MIPYSTQSITAHDIDAVAEVLRSGWLTQGPAVPRFEAALASAHGVAHGVAVCNATAALHIACLALDIGPGSRVWTSPISFVASANCARYCGADVDFVDVEPDTALMSVDALAAKLERAEREDALPQLVIPVAYAGQPCDLQAMQTLAGRYGFRLLDDASHAVGARYLDAPIGARHVDITVFSFHPVKVLTTGEGGMALTQDGTLAARMQLLRSHGLVREPAQFELAGTPHWGYEQQLLGYNYRMTDLQAALGCSQLERLVAMDEARHRLAARYDAAFAGAAVAPLVRHGDRRSALHLYPVRVDAARRDAAFAALRAAGIGVNLHYPPIHLQPYYRRLGFAEGGFVQAERYGREAISLPLYPALEPAQQDRVIDTLLAAVRAC